MRLSFGLLCKTGNPLIIDYWLGVTQEIESMFSVEMPQRAGIISSFLVTSAIGFEELVCNDAIPWPLLPTGWK
jgi:hypothetical protein